MNGISGYAMVASKYPVDFLTHYYIFYSVDKSIFRAKPGQLFVFQLGSIANDLKNEAHMVTRFELGSHTKVECIMIFAVYATKEMSKIQFYSNLCDTQKIESGWLASVQVGVHSVCEWGLKVFVGNIA